MVNVRGASLFGREKECEELFAFVQSPPPGPRLLTLQGEPGIGKTAMWQYGLREAEVRGIGVRSCQCVEAELALPFTALADLCDPLSPDDAAALPAPQRRALAVALLHEDEGDEGPVDPRAVGTALLGLLRIWSADHPLWHCCIRRSRERLAPNLAARRHSSCAGRPFGPTSTD